MKTQAIAMALAMCAQAIVAQTPYWTVTEDDQFLNDRAGLTSFTLSFYAFSVRFQQEESVLVAKKSFEVDSAGNITMAIQNDFNDNSSLTLAYLYDESGRLKEERILADNGAFFTTTTYSYGANSRKAMHYSLQGLDSVQEEVYDEQGRTVELTDYNAGGQVTSMFRDTYSPSSTTTDGYAGDGTQSSKSIMYHPNGRNSRREDYFGGKLDMVIAYQYTSSGQLASETGSDSQGNGRFVYEYSYLDRKLAESTHRAADGSVALLRYGYDEKGRLQKVARLNKVSKFGKDNYVTEYVIERTVNGGTH